MLLDTYAPIERINKYKLKFKSKIWITSGLQKLISVINKLLTHFINKKDPIVKKKIHTNYKDIEIYSSLLWRKVNRLIMIDILKEIGKIFRTHGNKSDPSFL